MKIKDAEKKDITIDQEIAPPAIEAIKRDAQQKPEKYLKDYTIPAEGE
jgi:hypothetical protein